MKEKDGGRRCEEGGSRGWTKNRTEQMDFQIHMIVSLKKCKVSLG